MVGFARGKPGRAGIGAVLRDANGHVFFLISKYIGIMDSNQVELEALCSAIELIVDHQGFPLPRIQVECDSMVMVSWSNRKGHIPWWYCCRLAAICDLLTHGGAILIRDIPREKNALADFFTKRGARVQGDMCFGIGFFYI